MPTDVRCKYSSKPTTFDMACRLLKETFDMLRAFEQTSVVSPAKMFSLAVDTGVIVGVAVHTSPGIFTQHFANIK